jgi:hypothetical protein
MKEKIIWLGAQKDTAAKIVRETKKGFFVIVEGNAMFVAKTMITKDMLRKGTV